jgi:pimeloyl-ACP methyl ester carboxylesterase
VWQCAGPPDAETLVLLPGVTMTAELCWFRVLERLGRQFRIVAPGLRGHGDGRAARSTSQTWTRAIWFPGVAGSDVSVNAETRQVVDR